MRIRYWSADVCSSDLLCVRGLICNNKRRSRSCKQVNANPAKELPFGFGYERVAWTHDHIDRAYAFCSDRQGSDSLHTAQAVDLVSPGPGKRSRGELVLEALDHADALAAAEALAERSEEHTSELQSLMRISYAVFCL